MADAESTLGIDATQAIRTLNDLRKTVQEYNRAIADSVKAAREFNGDGQLSVDQLARYTNETKNATDAMLKLLQLQKQLATESRKAATEAAQAQANLARSVVQAGLPSGNRAAATPQQIVNFDKSLDQFEKLVAKTNTSAETVRRILGNLSASYTGTERQIRDAIVKIQQANAKLGDTGGLQRTVTSIEAIGKSLKTFVAGAIVARAIREITQEFTQAVDAARRFELQIAQIQTVADKGTGLDFLADQVTRISGEFGRTNVDVATGLYQAFQNQVGDTAETLQFLNTALELSVATGSSATQSVDVLSSVLKAYNQNQAETTKNADILFRTIEVGRTTLEDLSGQLGRTLPLAAQLGVSFEEVGFAIAKATSQGITTDTALTQLLNVMVKLIKPSEALSEELNKIGITSARAGIQVFGFQGFLEKIGELSGGSAERLGELFTEIRALQGQLSFTAKGFEDLESKFRDFEGSVQRATDLIRATPAQELTETLTTLQSTLVNTFGREILVVLNQFVSDLGGVENIIEGVTAGFKVIGTVGGPIFRVLGLAAGGLLLELRGIEILLDPMGVRLRSMAEDAHAFDRALQEIAADELKNISKDFEKEAAEVDTATRKILQSLFTLQQAYAEDNRSAFQAADTVTNSLQRQLSSRVQLIEGTANELIRKAQQVNDRLKALDREQLDFEAEINRRRFDREISGGTDAQQGQALLRRAELLVQKADQAVQRGETDLAKDFIAEAAQRAEQAAGIAETAAQGEAAVNRVIEARRKLVADLKKTEQENAQEGVKNAEALFTSLDRIKVVQTDITSLTKEWTDRLKPGSVNPLTEEDAARLQKRLQDLSKEFDNLTSSALKDKVVPQFRDLLTGEPIELNIGVEKALTTIRSQITSQFDNAPLEIKALLKLTTGQDSPIGGNLGPQQDQISQKSQELTTQALKLKEQESSLLSTITAENANIVQNLQQVKGEVDRAISLLGGVVQLPSGQKIGTAAELEALGKNIEVVGESLAKATQQGNLEAVNTLRQTLASLVEEVKNLSVFTNDANLNTLFQGISSAVNSIGAAQLEIQKVNPTLQEVNKQLEAIKTLGTTLPATLQPVETSLLDVGTAGQQGASQATNALSTIGSTAAAQIGPVLQLVAALQQAAALGGGGGQFASSGGGVAFLSGGGAAPRGSDTVSAMLTPGEEVTNASSSRRFYAQLRAINAGVTPTYREAGGEVTNYHTGDITINTPPNQPVNADTLLSELQRRVRKGTFRIPRN